jgi:hypothetical protein
MNRKRIFYLVLFTIICALGLQARGSGVPDGVTVKDNQVYAMYGDRLEALTENLKLPFDVLVNTNGYFTVADGKERKLLEGEVIRRDGWLLEPGGSISPVFDNVAMRKGQVYVVRDGEATKLKGTMVFPNNMSVNSDGSGANLPSDNVRLADGQLFWLDGTPIPAKDSISLKNGCVVVQRDGSLLPPLSPGQMMGMNDGTKVFGNGTIQKPDGTSFKLREGQTILVAGAVYSR